MKILSILSVIVLATLLSLSFSSCGTADQTSQVEDASALMLCGGCGQLKGSDSCCDAGAESCPGCDLAKGSPGCCKIEKGSDAALCGGCGQIKGSDSCCDEDAEKCTGCGMAKGSPACCK